MGNVRRRQLMGGSSGGNFVMTAKQNPKIMATMYSTGFAASPKGMTEEELKAIPFNSHNSNNKGPFAGKDWSGEVFDAFKYCVQATNINYVFQSTKMKGITLPEGIKTIGLNALKGCGFSEPVIIPNSVTSIKNSACDSNWIAIWIFISDTPPTFGYSCMTGTLYVPDNSVQAYKTALTNGGGNGNVDSRVKPISELN